MEAAAGEARRGPLDFIRSLRRVRLGDAVFRLVVGVFGLSLLLLAVLMVWQLFFESRQSISTFGWGFLTSTTWDGAKLVFGAAPAIYGTLVSSVIAVLLAVPISLGAAIFLAELAPPWLRHPASFLVESLAAIPSVVFGVWGIYVLAPRILPVETALKSHLGFVPLFSGRVFGGYSMLTAGVILAIMILPIITAIARDSVLAVPSSQREAMLALGATKWEMISRAVLQYCRSGLVGAVLLGLGRALGETMAVTMVIGKVYQINGSLFAPAATAASQIATEFPDANFNLYRSALMELGLILLVITLFVNVAARLLVWTIARSPEAIRE
jgi:phosphate transport system permease protein